jgi:hypothetical protein
MNKVLLYIGGVIIVLFVGFFVLNNYIYTEKQGDTGFQAGYKDIAYTIQGRIVDLENGAAEIDGVTTKYFGNEVEGDLNEDGVSDIAFLLTQEPGGSGTFYYVVAALKTDDGYTGTAAAFLGDRIAPQTTEINAGRVVANYAERMEGEPMTTEPSLGVSKYFAVINGQLVEVDE